MQPLERTSSKEYPLSPGQARRQFRHPFQILSDASTQEQYDPYDRHPTTEALSDPKAQTPVHKTHIYEQLDKSLPPELFDVNLMSSLRLMQMSEAMHQANRAMRTVRLLPYAAEKSNSLVLKESWWLGGIENTIPRHVSLPGVLPEQVEQLPFDESHEITTDALIDQQPAAKPRFWQTSSARLLGTCLLGLSMLALTARFVNVPLTLHILQRHLGTPRGLSFACLAALFLTLAYCIRGTRWWLFLQPIGRVNLLQAIQLFWVAIFINFILPVQGGELAKSLMLKRISNIPVSQSLPTVAMDKALDLLPALVIMALVPFLPGIHMNTTLWIILGFVGSSLVGLICAVVFMALSRNIATMLLHRALKLLPRGLAHRIESFTFGFIDSLLAGASQPRIFLPAILLTLLAVSCDGLFALFSFWAVGVDTMTFWVAIFGYAVYTMFYILPTPPGHIGSNEFAGFIVFSTLLGYKQNEVTAMFIFSHPLGALIMGVACILCLSALGLSFSRALSLKDNSN